jgi:hypothetical protein
MNTACLPVPAVELSLGFHRYLQWLNSKLNFGHYKHRFDEEQKLGTYFALFPRELLVQPYQGTPPIGAAGDKS